MAVQKSYGKYLGLIFGGMLLVAAVSTQCAFASDSSEQVHKVIQYTRHEHERRLKEHPFGRRGPQTATNGIDYHNGPVMTGETHVYYIWYGNWDNANTAKTILPYVAAHIGGSNYYNTNTTYFDSTKKRVSNSVKYSGSIVDSYSRGWALTDLDVLDIVANAIEGYDPGRISGTLPYDPNGVYFVLSSADVTEWSGFCTKYCGWHTYVHLRAGDVKYAFVGNPETQCPAACGIQSVTPNGNFGADSMANVIVHELEESVTDPLINAWYDADGEENADKCAWTFGKTSTARNGSNYNVVLNGMKFMIQQNWVNARGGYCAMGL